MDKNKNAVTVNPEFPFAAFTHFTFSLRSFTEWKNPKLAKQRNAAIQKEETEKADEDEKIMDMCSKGAFAWELAEDIIKQVDGVHSPKDYRDYIRYIFDEAIEAGPDDPVWKLLGYLEKETDFYTAPASTHFHSSEQCGLVRHSLLVFANGIRLASALLSGDVDMYCLAAACLFHDLCKVNMYETKLRNIKNEETGIGEKAPYYKVRDEYLSFGHGIESMLRLNRFIPLPDAWNHAVRWHMGAYDISPSDKYALEKSLAAYKEVLFLQTADMQAGLVEKL